MSLYAWKRITDELCEYRVWLISPIPNTIIRQIYKKQKFLGSIPLFCHILTLKAHPVILGVALIIGLAAFGKFLYRRETALNAVPRSGFAKNIFQRALGFAVSSIAQNAASLGTGEILVTIVFPRGFHALCEAQLKAPTTRHKHSPGQRPGLG